MLRTKKILTPLIMICLALLPMLGCTNMIVWFTKEKASWAFIQDRCNGITLGKIEASSAQVTIPISMWDRYDSAVCIYDPKGYVNDNRIIISVEKGLCSGEHIKPLIVRIAKPQFGDYKIMYDDPDANFPVIGSVHVD